MELTEQYAFVQRENLNRNLRITLYWSVTWKEKKEVIAILGNTYSWTGKCVVG